ncbi:podocalyxin isoform X1 [Opisthocomus hoazin]|uniref:podocalyxin isoform X1 n=1 Tax=Opisthocomus hoazin TaxID=30419 RepID=UPI003F53DC97
MRAPLLLPLLLLGVSSQDVTETAPGIPGGSGQIVTTTSTSKTQATTPTSKQGNPPSTSMMSTATVQRTTLTSKPGNPPPTPVIPPTTVQGISPTSNPGNPPSSPAMSPAAVPRTSPTNNPGNPPPAPTTPPSHSLQVSSSASSGASTVTHAVTSSVSQQKTSPPASLGSTAATTAASPVPTHARGPPATPGGLGTAIAPSPSVQAQGSQPLDQLTSTIASTGVPTSSLLPGLKDYGISSHTSVTKQPQSSPSSPVQGLASSTRPRSTDTSVTTFAGAISPTTSKASLSLSPGSISRVSEAATTPTLGADQRSHEAETASTKPASADQSPTSAWPSAPAPGDQTASSSPGHQHPNASFQNEVICTDQVQNNWPTMYLKEARTCAEWRTVSINVSFFESFCSTGQHAFNASSETCTVILTSREPRSQHWAVRAVLHIPLDPEKVLKELKEKKDKLEQLGIANITYDKMEREMIINDEFSTPLIITIITLAGSLLLIAAIYGCCHQRFSQKKDQHIHPDLPGFDDGHVALIFNQRLTEELQTMENGYHDNPTLEVMETSSEMQEKKVNLNGELGDSWIVPLDTLMKEDLEEEEDTHL